MSSFFKDRIFILAALLLAVVIGSGVYLLLISLKPGQSKPPISQTVPSAPTPTPTPAPQDFVMKIGPQKPGITVTLDYLELTKTSWVVIHRDANGAPGEILQEGIPPAHPGIYQKIAFILRTPLSVGKYFAMLHVDNGDSNFEFPGADDPAINKKGETVMGQFTVK